MSRYNLNIRTFIKGLLPYSLRNENGGACTEDVLYVLTEPLQGLVQRFTHYRSDILSDLSYNSQYPNLQRLLNDRYDNQSRRIRVYDHAQIDELIVYPDAEIRPLALPIRVYPPNAYIYRGFIVIVPASFQGNDIVNKIIKTVNTYKFVGIYYELIYE